MHHLLNKSQQLQNCTVLCNGAHTTVQARLHGGNGLRLDDSSILYVAREQELTNMSWAGALLEEGHLLTVI